MTNITGTKQNEAAEAIQFALKQDHDLNGMEFLRLWNEGQFDEICRDWPEWAEIVAALPDEPAPDAVAAEREALAGLVAAWESNPHLPQEDGELPALDRARALVRARSAAPARGPGEGE